MSWKTFLTFLGYHWRYHAALIASWLIPRSKKIWVVGGSKGLRFADNARHFALQAKRQWPKQTIIWISPSAEIRAEAIRAGINSYHPTSLLGIWYSLRASWHIFDTSFKDINEFTGIGAKWLNLWHGVPLKSLDNIKPWPSTDTLSRLHDWWYRKNSQYHKKYLAYPTLAHFDYMSQILDLPLANIIAANLPRNQQLLTAPSPDLSSEELQLRQQLKQTGKTLIGYFPTWRDTGMDKFMGALNTEDISALNALLEKHNTLLITKWHSCSYVEYQHRGVSQTAAEIDQNLAQSSHIMALPFQCDLNTVLDCCSMLISDYSGVLIDYLLLQRPIIQIPYDQEEYKMFTGVMPDYEQFAAEAGPLAENFTQLLNQLERYLNHSDDWQKEYKLSQEKLKHYYFATTDSITALESVLQPMQ
ncbi:CDP-glycerol glycerophosphotransferase family protein [Rheinheimera metallidurans]|uniref:CDP-glycerol glycerophosphotransferase family protein n=1 Tax=Rheinheimera metallidurans TaxID=2925781 RepID=UPI0030016771